MSNGEECDDDDGDDGDEHSGRASMLLLRGRRRRRGQSATPLVTETFAVLGGARFASAAELHNFSVRLVRATLQSNFGLVVLAKLDAAPRLEKERLKLEFCRNGKLCSLYLACTAHFFGRIYPVAKAP